MGYHRGEKGNSLLDAQTGVTIGFLVSGPAKIGGRPLVVDIPAPCEVSVEIDGIRFITLAELIKLKLASGMVPNRLRDHADVQSIIQVVNLPADFGDDFEPALRDCYREYWGYAQIAAKDGY